MAMLSKAAIGIAAGICGTLFIGYCVYFDHKRRSDPNFKRKLKERRRAKEIASNARSGNRTKMPDLRDHEAVQVFFLREIQLGEEMLGRGDVDGGVEHLCNAVTVCGQPNQLLQVLQQTLPPHVFQLLIQRLPNASRNLQQQPDTAAPMMAEEDVE